MILAETSYMLSFLIGVVIGLLIFIASKTGRR